MGSMTIIWITSIIWIFNSIAWERFIRWILFSWDWGIIGGGKISGISASGLERLAGLFISIDVIIDDYEELLLAMVQAADCKIKSALKGLRTFLMSLAVILVGF